MAKKEAYWLGPGVLTHGGKDIHPGKLIPDSVDEETVERHIKNGKATRTPKIAVAGEDDSAKYLEQIKELSGKLSAAEKDLETVTAERDDLLAKSEQQETTIKSLTDQLTKNAGKSAGPGK